MSSGLRSSDGVSPRARGVARRRLSRNIRAKPEEDGHADRPLDGRNTAGVAESRMSASVVSGLVCLRCGRRAKRGLDGPCPRCRPEGVLDIELHLGKARRHLTRRALASRTQDMWRYRELLPVPEGAPRPPAPVCWNTLVCASR